MNQSLPTLTKQPWDDKLYDVVLDEDDFRTGEEIASVVSAEVTNLGWVHESVDVILAGVTHDSNRTVQFRLSGGEHLEGYQITGRVATNLSNKIEFDVLLKVFEE